MSDARGPGGRGLATLDRVTRSLPVLVPVFLLACLYAWQASAQRTPWLFGDELEFTQISRAIAETGHAARRGEPLTSQLSVYPWLTAPAWWIDNTRTAYETVKVIGVLAMTAAYFPAYALARLVVSRWAAIFAATATAAIPALVYSSFIVEEPLAYFWSIFSLYLVVRALTAPTRARAAMAAVACLSGSLFRDELIVLTFVLLAGAGLVAWQSEPVRRRRARASYRLKAVWATALVAAVVVAHVAYSSRSREWDIATDHPGKMLDYGLWAVGSLAIGLGVLPLVAGLTALVAQRERHVDPAERAFRAVLAASLVGFGLYTAGKAAYISTNFALRVEERNLIYVAPLLLIGTALALEHGRPRLWLLAGSTALTAYVLVTTPFQMDSLFYFDAPGLAILAGARRSFDWTPEYAESVLLGLLVLAVAASVAPRVLLGYRRAALATSAVVGALVIGWGLTGEIAAADGSRGAADAYLAELPQPVDWLDRATGGAPALYIGQQVTNTNPANLLEFWNRSLRRVYSLDGTAPGPGPTVTPNLASKFGTLEADPGYEYVVTDANIRLVGTVIERKSNGWLLYRIAPPLRLEQSVSGIFGDGWLGARREETIVKGTYSRFATPQNRAGTIFVSVSRTGGDSGTPGRVLIRVGTLALGDEFHGAIDRLTAERGWVVKSGLSRTFAIPTPRPPFQVEVTVSPPFVPSAGDLRWLGAQVSFDWEPAG